MTQPHRREDDVKIAILENELGHVKTDLADIRTDVSAIREDISSLTKKSMWLGGGVAALIFLAANGMLDLSSLVHSGGAQAAETGKQHETPSR